MLNKHNKINIKNNVPKLRFPGFSGEWGEKRLGDCLDYEQPTNYIVHSTEYNDSYKTPVLTAGKSFILGYTNEEDDIFDNLPVIIFDDFTTASQFVDFPFKVKSSAMKILKPKDRLDIRFIFGAMSQIKYKIGGHGRHWISKYSNIKFFIPNNNKEQQKIAEFLGSIDEWIENLKNQKKSFEAYKKGLMQKIFSQEIRFKDDSGKDFPKWEEKRLGDTGEVITGSTPPTANKEYYNGTFPWITPTDINHSKNIYSSAKLLTKKGLSVARLIPKNSLLVTCIASIGKNVILRLDGSCNQQINAIYPNKNNDVDFLYYLVEKNKNILIRFAGAGGMQMLNKKDFSNLTFKIPTIGEQQKIAEFLGSVDNLIESKEKQVSQAEQWKKGLMQRLFV